MNNKSLSFVMTALLVVQILLLSLPVLAVDENSYRITVEDDSKLSSFISDLTRAIIKAPDLYGYTETDLRDVSLIGPYKITTQHNKK